VGHYRYYSGGVIMIPDWPTERADMLEWQLRRRGIHDERVLAAMGWIPREEFLPLEMRVAGYKDEPAPIGGGQTISQPYMTALMAQELELRGTETVLEVGAGSGYAAAVLGALAARVVAMELVPALARMAEQNLARTGCGKNVTVVCGDGSQGYPECAPYDGISVAAAVPEVPERLLEQLAEGGRLVIPIGDFDDQELRVIVKTGDRTRTRVPTHCRFVPLRGHSGFR
jgi:protein-L-isoaspartate(D-aspartate) O-methyltransferase